MASWRDEIKKSMDTVVPETRVTLDPRLLGENIVVLTLKVTNYFLEAGWSRKEYHKVPRREKNL